MVGPALWQMTKLLAYEINIPVMTEIVQQFKKPVRPSDGLDPTAPGTYDDAPVSEEFKFKLWPVFSHRLLALPEAGAKRLSAYSLMAKARHAAVWAESPALEVLSEEPQGVGARRLSGAHRHGDGLHFFRVLLP